MAAIVEILCPTEQEQDGWRVAVDGRCVVAFFGSHARELAEYHRDALQELLAADPEGGRPCPPVEMLGESIGSRASSIFPPTLH